MGYLTSSACPYEVDVFIPILQMEKLQSSVSASVKVRFLIQVIIYSTSGSLNQKIGLLALWTSSMWPNITQQMVP